jgi:hypothetical protein
MKRKTPSDTSNMGSASGIANNKPLVSRSGAI